MKYIKVYIATRWTFRHGLMLFWFKDLMNVNEKLRFIDPTFRHSLLVPSSKRCNRRSFYTLTN